MTALGMEKTPELFVAHMVAIFAEVHRVLKPTGCVFLNLGDSYCNAGTRNQGTGLGGKRRGGVSDTDGTWASAKASYGDIRYTLREYGIKHKDLIGIPWMVAFALRANGWYLRRDIIWAKGISGQACEPCECGRERWHGSNMPESPKDRPTSSHEYVFMLTKEPRYWYDYYAVRERGASPAGTKGGKGSKQRSAEFGVNARPPEYSTYDGKRNRRSVWTISTRPFKGSHYATFPPDLVEPCLLAGCAPQVCSECGTPYEHRVSKDKLVDHPDRANRNVSAQQFDANGNAYEDGGTLGKVRIIEDLGYHPACECSAPPIPGLVLDPFSGSGTTAFVAQQHGRRSLGIDLADQTEVMRVRWGKPKDDPAAQNTLDMDVEVVVPGVAITHHRENAEEEATQ